MDEPEQTSRRLPQLIPSTTGSADSRRKWILLGVLVCGMLASLTWSVQPYWDAYSVGMNDSAMYIVAGRSLAEGKGYSMFDRPFVLRPPGFSALLAVVIACRGMDFFYLNLLVSLFGVLLVACLYLWACPRLGTSLALCVCITLWLNPEFQRHCNRIMSEIPFVAALLLALVLARRPEHEMTMRRDTLLGIVMAATVYLRSVGLLLLPALVLDRAAQRLRSEVHPESRLPFILKRVVCPVTVAAALYAPWAGYADPHKSFEPGRQTLVYSYWTALFHTDVGDPKSPRLSLQQWTARTTHGMRYYASYIGSRMRSLRPSAGAYAVAVIAIVCWAAMLWRRRSAAEWFVGGVMLVIAGYQPAGRLALPVFVFLLIFVAECGVLVLSRLGLRDWIGQTVICLAFAAVAVLDFERAFVPPAVIEDYEHRVELADYIREHYPEDVVLCADRGPHHAALIGRTVYSIKNIRGHMNRLRDMDRLNVGVYIAQPGQQEKMFNQLLIRRDGIAARIGPFAIIEAPMRNGRPDWTGGGRAQRRSGPPARQRTSGRRGR